MKQFILVLILIVGNGSSARADISDTDAWTGFANDYENYQKVLNSGKDSTKEFKKFEKAKDKLVNDQKTDQELLAQENAKLEKLQTEQTKLNASVAAIGTPTPSDGVNWFTGNPKKSFDQKALDSSNKNLKKVTEQINEEKARVAETQGQLTQMQAVLAPKADAAKAAATKIAETDAISASGAAAAVGAAGAASVFAAGAAAASAAAAGTGAASAAMMNRQISSLRAQVSAQSVITQQKEINFNAKQMFTTFQNLQIQGKLTDMQAADMRKQWNQGSQLNNTPVGDYVNNQIQRGLEATCDPDFQTACKAGVPAGINKLIAGYLNPAQVSDPAAASTSSAATDKVVVPEVVAPAAKVAAPVAAPANPQK